MLPLLRTALRRATVPAAHLRAAVRDLLRRGRVRVIVPTAGLALLAACSATSPVETSSGGAVVNGVPVSQFVEGYGILPDNGYRLPPVPPQYLEGVNRRAFVAYPGTQSPGTIEIDPHAKFLYWVMDGGMAMRYPIAVGREGLGMSGTTTVGRKAEWPGWTPTANMLRREPEIYEPFRGGVPGGLSSPLGARALYLYRGGRDTYYRIHGTNDLTSIGNSGSAGCIRLFNHDVIDLYERVPTGTTVVVRTYSESVRIEGEALANRGVEMPPYYVPPEELLHTNDDGPSAAPYSVFDGGGTLPQDPLGAQTL